MLEFEPTSLEDVPAPGREDLAGDPDLVAGVLGRPEFAAEPDVGVVAPDADALAEEDAHGDPHAPVGLALATGGRRSLAREGFESLADGADVARADRTGVVRVPHHDRRVALRAARTG